MTSRTVTCVLAAIALSLAVALAVVLLQRPHPGVDMAAAPTIPASENSVTAAPDPTPLPTTEETDVAAEGGPSSLPSSEVEADDANPGATPYSQTADARRQWEPVATGFGRAFTATDGKDAAQWRKSLAAYVTGQVREQLATVDLSNVPDGRFDSIEPAEYGEDKVAVFVHYDTGLTLVTYLILDGRSWRIYAYDRWVD